MSSTSIAPGIIDALRIHLSDTPIYHRFSVTGVDFQPWNSAKTADPIARVECRTASEVQKVLSIAQSFGTPLAVAGGRHDPWTRNYQDEHIILDLRRMNDVVFNRSGSTVAFGGGTTIAQLLNCLPEDMVAVTGANAGVGMVGLTLGGGYGMLNNRFGLVCDTMQSAEVILADGQMVTASDQGDADLFWALRGGGSGFGVVTSITLRSFALPTLLSATILVPLHEAQQALLLMQSWLDAEPESINIIPLFMIAPDGKPSLFLSFVWTGGAQAAEEFLSSFTALSGAQVLKKEWVKYKNSLDPSDLWPWGRHWQGETQIIERIDEQSAAALVEAARALPGPYCILFLQSFHGAPTKIDADRTAFSQRGAHFVAAILASRGSNDENEVPLREWIKKFAEKLAAHALPGGYINFLHPNDTLRVRQFYGPAADRLAAIKRKVDPHSVFNASTGKF